MDNSSIYSADISLEGCDLNEDIINDTNRSMDFGKIFNYLYIYFYVLYKTNIFFLNYSRILSGTFQVNDSCPALIRIKMQA